MKFKLFIAVVASAVIVFGGACRKKKSNSDTSDDLIEARFFDAAVRGIGFTRSNGVSGLTTAEGVFRCARGEEIIFDIQGIEVGRAPCGDFLFVQSLLALYSDYIWGRTAAIIQSLSIDVVENNEVVEHDLSAAQELIQELVKDSKLTWDATIFEGTDAEYLKKMTGIVETVIANAPDNSSLKNLTAKSVETATKVANTFRENYILEKNPISSKLTTALKAATALGSTELTFNLSAGDTECEACWKHYKVWVDIEKSDSLYQMVVKKMVGYDDRDKLDDDATCSTTASTKKECATLPSARYPATQIISGAETTMMNQWKTTKPDGIANRILAISLSAKDDGTLVFQGSASDRLPNSAGTDFVSRTFSSESIDAGTISSSETTSSGSGTGGTTGGSVSEYVGCTAATAVTGLAQGDTWQGGLYGWCQGNLNNTTSADDREYFVVTPSLCTDSDTPTCSGGGQDTLTKNWTDATTRCANLVYGGYSDWVLLPYSGTSYIRYYNNENNDVLYLGQLLSPPTKYWTEMENAGTDAFASVGTSSFTSTAKTTLLNFRCARVLSFDDLP